MNINFTFREDQIGTEETFDDSGDMTGSRVILLKTPIYEVEVNSWSTRLIFTDIASVQRFTEAIAALEHKNAEARTKAESRSRELWAQRQCESEAQPTNIPSA